MNDILWITVAIGLALFGVAIVLGFLIFLIKESVEAHRLSKSIDDLSDDIANLIDKL